MEAVEYQPPPGYGYDVELYRHEELRRRAAAVGERLERIDFHVLLYLTRGGYRHMLDFDFVDCEAGSLVILRPGQVHRFGDVQRFVGWLLIFRAEVLPPSRRDEDAHVLDLSRQLEGLPAHVRVPKEERGAITATIEQMAHDAAREPSPAVNTLLVSELHALLVRLQVIEAESGGTPEDPAVMDRYRRFRAAIDGHYREWHAVKHYAKRLGCSPKSLNRAARAGSDTTAKRLITDRVVLEAKRLLVHTPLSVAAIADELGFDEATNFVKVFRRATSTTPGAFRRRHRSDDDR